MGLDRQEPQFTFEKILMRTRASRQIVPNDCRAFESLGGMSFEAKQSLFRRTKTN
jgi:hypothetical protein